MTHLLPNFLREMLSAPPRAGEGVHGWLFHVSRQMHAHLPAVEIIALLENRAMNCGRHVPRSEIVAAVQNSLSCAWKPGVPRKGMASPMRVSTWPEVNQTHRAEVVNAGGGLADLWETSPSRLESNSPQTEEIIDKVFPRDALLCCGKTSSVFDTRTREEWRGELTGLQLIVPSPMSAVEGVTKEGKTSRHCLSNTGPRRFLVIEQDSGSEDEQAAILLHLAARAPLVLAVHSGGRSLHAWLYCAGQPEEKLRQFMRYAVTLGADPATWTRSQFVRMPDGRRDNGRRQTVFFFNPRPLGVSR